MASWMVPEQCCMVDEGLVCYDSCLLESIHSFDNIHIDKALIVDYVQQVILVDDFLWYSCYVKFNILWIWESIVEVKVFISAKTRFSARVDTTLLNRHLAVVMVAVGVVIVPA